MTKEVWAQQEAGVAANAIIDRFIAMMVQKGKDRSLLDKVFSPAFRRQVAGVILSWIQSGWESPFGWSTQPPSDEPGADRMDLLRRTFDAFIAETCAKS